MRIRRHAARCFGSTSVAAPAAPAPVAAAPFEELPAPPLTPPPAPCSEPIDSSGNCGLQAPATVTVLCCELNSVVWDINEVLCISDPVAMNEAYDSYFVGPLDPTWWNLPAVPVEKKNKEPAIAAAVAGEDMLSRPQVAKKKKKPVAKKPEKDVEAGAKEKEKGMTKNEGGAPQPRVYRCKKNDGKLWYCRRAASAPNSFCEYHIRQRRRPSADPAAAGEYKPAAVAVEKKKKEATAAAAAAAPAAARPKPSSGGGSSSRPRKRKPRSDISATAEDFYYYIGFGPFRSGRLFRAAKAAAEAKEEEEALDRDTAAILESLSRQPPLQAAAEADGGNNNQEVAAGEDDGAPGVDADGSIAGADDHEFDGIGGMEGGGADAGRKVSWKGLRKKHVKMRSLMSLM